MDRKEALVLMNKAETLFKKYDDFKYVEDLYDPIKILNQKEDTRPDSESTSFQLEFSYKSTNYILGYNNSALTVIDKSQGLEHPIVHNVNSFEEVINLLEKDER